MGISGVPRPRAILGGIEPVGAKRMGDERPGLEIHAPAAAVRVAGGSYRATDSNAR
jgi:hypothetical protein